jgi:dTMP kinase
MQIFDPNVLIVLEGPEGAGKTTMAKRLAEEIGARYLREPGGDDVSEAIRKVLLNPAHKGMSSLAEFFLFQASRAQFVRNILTPALKETHVILDRYSLSTMAYQITGRRLPMAACLSAIELATDGLVPDLTLLLMCSYETGKSRQVAAGKVADRLESETRDFHDRVASGYRNFAQCLPTWNINLLEVDAMSEEEVFSSILPRAERVIGVR